MKQYRAVVTWVDSHSYRYKEARFSVTFAFVKHVAFSWMTDLTAKRIPANLHGVAIHFGHNTLVVKSFRHFSRSHQRHELSHVSKSKAAVSINRRQIRTRTRLRSNCTLQKYWWSDLKNSRVTHWIDHFYSCRMCKMILKLCTEAKLYPPRACMYCYWCLG